VWVGYTCDPTPFCHYGKGQKTGSSSNKRKEQDDSRQTVLHGLCQRKAKHNRGIEDKIKNDVKKTTPIAGMSQPRESPINSISNSVYHQTKKRTTVTLEKQSRQDPKADKKRDNRHLICSYAKRVQQTRALMQRLPEYFYGISVKHRLLFLKFCKEKYQE
jgi:hypothetical protein